MWNWLYLVLILILVIVLISFLMGGKKTVESFEGECPPGTMISYNEDGSTYCIQINECPPGEILTQREDGTVYCIPDQDPKNK